MVVLCSCERHFKFIAPIYPQDCTETGPAELSRLALLSHRLEAKKTFPYSHPQVKSDTIMSLSEMRVELSFLAGGTVNLLIKHHYGTI